MSHLQKHTSNRLVQVHVQVEVQVQDGGLRDFATETSWFLLENSAR
jgi:hypothetical protein